MKCPPPPHLAAPPVSRGLVFRVRGLGVEVVGLGVEVVGLGVEVVGVQFFEVVGLKSENVGLGSRAPTTTRGATCLTRKVRVETPPTRSRYGCVVVLQLLREKGGGVRGMDGERKGREGVREGVSEGGDSGWAGKGGGRGRVLRP